MLCVGGGRLAGLTVGGGLQGRWARRQEQNLVEREKECWNFKFHATEHINQIEHELNKCIRETQWDNLEQCTV